MVNYPGFLSAELLQPALTELPALLTEADLHIAQLSLAVLSSVCHLAQPAAALVQSGFMVKVSAPTANTIRWAEGVGDAVIRRSVGSRVW